MKLEDQLARLAELGLSLADGITIDDLLYSFPRDAYEDKLFELTISSAALAGALRSRQQDALHHAVRDR